MWKHFVFALLLLAGYSAQAQNDTYLMRDRTVGKDVKPAVPPRPLYVPKPNTKPGIRNSIQLKYPVLAFRLGVEGDVWLNFTVAPNGQVTEAVCERVDSLVVGRY